MKKDTSSDSLQLTNREKQILLLITEGLTSKQIAKKLTISEHTVKTHRKKLIKKLNVTNTASLVRFAIENKIVTHTPSTLLTISTSTH